ncbi:histidine kinase [Streptomyces sp. NBC_00513]|uniref:sensor histidine kinase n=1 Tax=unclassified Streptomyces TaxID=2593676 RepID=UPI00224CBF5C|nr:histidine kinase [Streptomyces sp. NBC_00424]MCX5073647.1 histidine kinase [Streptomyces sp. NBC_00424]WUD43118.1 histidine kinase [Streptomyces sp. NBC_00513]
MPSPLSPPLPPDPSGALWTNAVRANAVRANAVRANAVRANAVRANAVRANVLLTNALWASARRVLVLRLALIAVGAPAALERSAPGGPTHLTAGALLLTFTLSYAAFRAGERLGPLVPRHRALLAWDMALVAPLLVVAGPALPLGLVCLCTPLLAGLLHDRRGAAGYAVAQAALVAALTAAKGGLPSLALPAHTLPSLALPAHTLPSLALPALCLLAGAAGACLRDLLTRFDEASRTRAETAARLAATQAARTERDRLAREMHDSVSKTLHGLALAADALSRTADPAAVHHQARTVAEAARRAAAESRHLLTELRGDGTAPTAPPAPVTPLVAQLRSLAASHPGVALHTTGTVPPVPPALTRDLVAVAAEALENARRHASASHVDITAAASPTGLCLTITDDGRGLPPGGPDPAHLRATGHFGLLGMTERAAALGAHLAIGPPATGPGTRVRLEMPLGSP